MVILSFLEQVHDALAVLLYLPIRQCCLEHLKYYLGNQVVAASQLFCLLRNLVGQFSGRADNQYAD